MLYYVHNCNPAKPRARNIKRLSNHIKNMSYQTSSTTKFNSLFGAFDIIIKNKHTNPKAIFIFYNNIEDKITHFMIYEGKSFYRYFNRFINESIEDISKKNVKNKNSKSIVLVPQNTINKINIALLKEKLNIYIEEYKIRDSGLPKVIHNNKNEICSQFPSSDFNIKKVSEIVHKLNLNLHIIKKNIGKNLASNIRSFSTLSKSYKNKTSIVNPSRALIVYSGKEYYSIPVDRPEDNINPYPSNQDLKEYKLKNLKYNWKSFTSNINYSVVGIKELRKELEQFFILYNNKYPKHEYFAIIFKISFRNGSVRSCSTAQIAQTGDFDKLLSIFSFIFCIEDFADKVSDDERELVEENGLPSGKIIFDFKPMLTVKGTKYEGLISSDKKNKTVREDKDYTKTLNYKGFKIPTHMDLTLWSNITFSKDFKNAHSVFSYFEDVEEYNVDFMFQINENNYFTTVMNKGKLLFTFSDTLNDGYNLSNFNRVITENEITKTYVYNAGKLLFYLEDKKTSFIDKIMKDFKMPPKLLTLDLETRTIEEKNGDRKMVPICMSIYDGRKASSFLFKDPNNWQEDMREAIKTIMIRKYDYYKIYVHNFSYFDAIFMIDVLSKLGKVKPLMRDNKILKLNFIFETVNDKTSKKNNRKCRLIFYDSYLLLQGSLNNLSKSFNIKNKKSIFPLNFVNQKDFDFNYIGDVPEYKYFYKAYTDDFTLSDYKKYCEQYKDIKWHLEKELYIYCEIDTIALYQIIEKFHEDIYSMFKIDITKYSTLPSIAFAIYRSNYMPENKIPKILSKLHYTIKRSYYGGITDIYRPFGKNIRSYDVNSLYPSSMKYYRMPVGKHQIFSGNPYLIEKNPFGFFKVTVFAPTDMKVPFLPKKVYTKNGTRTIFPVGSWTGWYFSEEIKNAEKYGYKFVILEGYLFERDFVFNDYIDKLYKMKEDAAPTESKPGDQVKYFIAKLLMNALYGRFGMNPVTEETCIVSSTESEKIIKLRKNVKVIPLLSGNAMLSYNKVEDEEVDITNISVSISSAIAAYSRIEMSHYLNKYRNNIYAVDTDGIKVDCKLDSLEIDDKKLGKMKYEYTLKEAVFPAPKVYGGLLEKPYKKYKTEITKIKGLKNPISYFELKTVLNKNNPFKIDQEKWKRVLPESTIIVKIESYTLNLTESKRELIFNSWGDLVDTIPIYLNNGEIVKRNPPLLYYISSPESFLPLPAPKNLLYLPSPISHLTIKAPVEEKNIIYILPKVFYMAPPLASVIYLPGKIQERLPPPLTRLALPPPLTRLALSPPEVDYTVLKDISIDTALPKVIYIDPSLPTIIYIQPSLPYIIRLGSPKGCFNNKPLFSESPVTSLILLMIGCCIKMFRFVISRCIIFLFSTTLIVLCEPLLPLDKTQECNLKGEIEANSNPESLLSAGSVDRFDVQINEEVKEILLTNDDIRYIVAITISYFIIKFLIIYYLRGSSGSSTSSEFQSNLTAPDRIETSNLPLPSLPEIEGPFSPASLDLFEVYLRDRATVENVVTGIVDVTDPLISF